MADSSSLKKIIRHDDQVLEQRLGYKQQMNRGFSRISLLAMGFCVLNTWQALGSTLSLALQNGGPTAILWGCIFCMFGNIFIALSMAELTSAWPTACGSYHWVSQIIPEHKWYRRFGVWITGWTNLVAWWMMAISAGILGARCIMAGGIIITPDFYPALYQTWLVYLGIVLTGGLFNTFCISIMHIYTKVTLYWSIIAFVVFIIVIVATTDNDQRADASWVFGGFANINGWSDGGAWLVGMAQSAALCFTGYDSIVHMCEELPNPSVAAPFAIIFTPITGGITGFLFLIALLFQVSDIDAASTAYIALAEIASSSAGVAGGVILTMFIAIGLGVGTYLDIMTCSRLTYALARDNAFIFPKFFNHVNSKFRVPVRAVWISTIIIAAIGAISCGSDSAINAIIGGTVIFINWSYCLPIVLLLIYGRDKLTDRPFSLGKYGPVINVLGVLYGLFTSILNFLPFILPVTSQNMNYVCVVVGGIYILLLIYWFVWARKLFVVPQMELAGSRKDIIDENSSGAFESNDNLDKPAL